MTGPGTAITVRDSSSACPAVLSAPLRIAASTTTVPRPSAAITRLRSRNRRRVGRAARRQLGHHGTARRGPSAAGRRAPPGRRTSTPQASTATVGPSTASAPRCAAASMPYAPPDTTVQPRSPRPDASSAATCSPYGVQARAPTTATLRRATSPRSAVPDDPEGQRRPVAQVVERPPATRRRPGTTTRAPARSRRGRRRPPGRAAGPGSARAARRPQPRRRGPGRAPPTAPMTGHGPAEPGVAGLGQPGQRRPRRHVGLARAGHPSGRPPGHPPAVERHPDVAGVRPVAPGQVGQRPRDPEHPVDAAGGERAAVEQPLGLADDLPGQPPQPAQRRGRAPRR